MVDLCAAQIVFASTDNSSGIPVNNVEQCDCPLHYTVRANNSLINHKCLFRDNTAEDVHCNCDINQNVMLYYIVHTYACLLCIWKISTLNISILEITFLDGKNFIFCYVMCHFYHFLTFSNIPVSKYLFDCFLLFPSFLCWVGHFID